MSDEGGTGVFFFVLPLMLAGALIAAVLRQRSTWGMGRRVVLVVGVGAGVSLAAYLGLVGLHLLPDKPLLLASAFVITQLAAAPSLADADRARSNRSPVPELNRGGS